MAFNPMSACSRSASSLLLVAVMLGAAELALVRAASMHTQLVAIDKELQRLADHHLFAGMAFATKGSSTVFSKGYGHIFPEWGTRFPKNPADVRYHIGSNMRIIVAVAAWQQHVAGVLNVFDTIDKYLNNTDFNMNTTWCPRLWNETSGPCMFPSLAQLMSHTSGFVDNGVHCRFPVGSWQASYCYSGPNGTDFNLNVASNFAFGSYSPLQHLIAVQHVRIPLQYIPGTTFEDMTIDDVYLAAVLEKRLGLPLRTILKNNVLSKAGMSSSYYDASNRNDGAYLHYLPLPGYNSFVSPLSMGMYALDWPYIGNQTVQSGDIMDATRDPEGAPFGTYVKLGRSSLGIDPAWIQIASAAGALISTFNDMQRFMHVLTRDSGRLNLTQDVVRQIFSTGEASRGLWYGQGIISTPCPNKTLGTPWTFYVGNMGYSAIQYNEFRSDPADDVTVSFVMYTKPITDAFTFNDDLKSTGSGGDPKDPLNPDNKDTVCLMSLAEYTRNSSVFMPQYGANGGTMSRDPDAWFTFLEQAVKAGSKITKGPVPAPHIYCDAQNSFPPGIDYYYAGRIAQAVAGRSWLSTQC